VRKTWQDDEQREVNPKWSDGPKSGESRENHTAGWCAWSDRHPQHIGRCRIVQPKDYGLKVHRFGAKAPSVDKPRTEREGTESA
jgi:hypothetical protein